MISYAIRIPRSVLPSDCFDIYLHLKNVMCGMIDPNSMTELYLRDNVYNVVCSEMSNDARIVDVTYALLGNDITFKWITL